MSSFVYCQEENYSILTEKKNNKLFRPILIYRRDLKLVFLNFKSFDQLTERKRLNFHENVKGISNAC